MKKDIILGKAFVLMCLIWFTSSASIDCQNPLYIIPYQPLDQIFDKSIDTMRAQKQLVSLLQDPNSSTAKDYLLSLAPFSAPFFAMAGVTLAIFIGTIVQVICFNSCGKSCCGNQINDSTYNVCCLRAFVASFVILSFFVILLSITGMILNSDLQQAASYVSCNTENIIYQTYNGNNNQTVPWSGTNNFQSSINIFAASIQNSVPFLLNYFSNQNPSYNQIVDNTPGSAYSNSQNFNCQNSNTPIVCPFPSTIQVCETPYQATFNNQFCNSSYNGSAANLISNEMSVNSSTWRNSTLAITSTLNALNVDSSNVQPLQESILEFTNSIGYYQTSIQEGFGTADNIQWAVMVAFYTFYALILTVSLLSLISLCMAYFCNNFKCRFTFYIYWYLFFILSFLLFIDSGFFNAGSIFAFDTCSAYPYYFTNQTNFNTLDFNGLQIGSIFSTCFFTNKTVSMFAAFNNTGLLNQFGNLYSQYSSALPSNQFSSVVSTIQNQLYGYALNPNTITIQNLPSFQQPAAALNSLNLQANYSAPGSTQACRLTLDYFTFNVATCGLYLTNQPVGTNCCIVLDSVNTTNIVNGRVNAFNSHNCGIDAANYQSRVNSLNQYGQSINSIVFELAPLNITNTPLQNYQNFYYNYYANVQNFYNTQTQQVFNSILVPYVSLWQGSGCPFIKDSMDGIVDIGCNQLQPFINALSVVNIICSIFVFILFIISYFLTTRLQFYEFLEGDLSKAKVIKVPIEKTKQQNEQIQMRSTKFANETIEQNLEGDDSQRNYRKETNYSNYGNTNYNNPSYENNTNFQNNTNYDNTAYNNNNNATYNNNTGYDNTANYNNNNGVTYDNTVYDNNTNANYYNNTNYDNYNLNSGGNQETLLSGGYQGNQQL